MHKRMTSNRSSLVTKLLSEIFCGRPAEGLGDLFAQARHRRLRACCAQARTLCTRTVCAQSIMQLQVGCIRASASQVCQSDAQKRGFQNGILTTKRLALLSYTAKALSMPPTSGRRSFPKLSRTAKGIELVYICTPFFLKWNQPPLPVTGSVSCPVLLFLDHVGRTLPSLDLTTS